MILRRLAAGLIRHPCATRVTSGRDLVLYTTPAESTKIKIRTTRILFSTHKKSFKKKKKHKSKLIFAKIKKVRTTRIPIHLKKEKFNIRMLCRISKQRAKSQAIDATRHLYALQYPVWFLSRLQMIHGRHKSSFAMRTQSAYGPGRKRLSGLQPISAPKYITRASRVSGLEAFSRHPTHGSFRALAFPPTLFAGRASPLFLSYWRGLLLAWLCNSRIKLTCLATV